MLDTILHALIVVFVPPLLLGVIGKTKAAFAGRTGPPLLQLYYDLGKLFRKGSVFSTTTSWVFRAGPVVGLAAPLAASLLVPFGNHPAPVSFAGDLILFAYLFALSRFFTAAAALDTGSAFEGMGAAREVSFACLAEPALFFGLVVVAKISGSLSLSPMLAAPWASGWTTAGAPLVLVVAAWLVVLLVENCRIPFDDPNTHLELTMIHEVMVLDHGGPALGLILYGAAVKLFVFTAMLIRIVVPVSAPGWAAWLVLAGGTFAISVAIGVVESTVARLRLSHVPAFLLAACLLCALGVVLLVR
ncbi:MAG TPA: NADH-quinone oxidoreductase subunit H [Thermoanaerobaculia bacterium]|nr:NADH-quinone oxidoreductase subunit H [Thermoanaerobaculia bacterium]